MNNATFVLVLLGSTLFMSSNASAQGYNSKSSYDQTIKDVSILQLITNPQAYDNAKVRFIAYLRLEFEGNALYLHREDFQNGITRNGIWVDAPHGLTQEQREQVNNRYVICTGTFRASGHGHMGLFSRELADVTRLEPWPYRRS